MHTMNVLFHSEQCSSKLLIEMTALKRLKRLKIYFLGTSLFVSALNVKNIKNRILEKKYYKMEKNPTNNKKKKMEF